ncbi:hypothetical protein, partial [Phocaeicola sp.]
RPIAYTKTFRMGYYVDAFGRIQSAPTVDMWTLSGGKCSAPTGKRFSTYCPSPNNRLLLSIT